MVILSHLTGNANVKAVARGFLQAGMLAEFHVALAAFPGGILAWLSTFEPFLDIRRRQFIAELQPFTRTSPWMEVSRILAPKVGLAKLTNTETAPFYIDAVVRSHDRQVASRLRQAAKTGVTAVYGYEDTVLFAFQEAKRLKLSCLYDLPIGYWRSAHRLLSAERERWPDWATTLNGLQDSEAKLARKDEELRLADTIFVASSFTASTLKDFPGQLAPIKIIPYGFPSIDKIPRAYNKTYITKKLKVLFVGSLSQRKGIADLFAAVKNLAKHIELTIVGNKTTDDCQPLNESLRQHRWIPSLAHNEILKLMRESDVLVLPSLFEGFGLVITEAMSQGTPVITTERTAGPDLIIHEQNGWLIPAGSILALQDTLEKLLYQPQIIENVGRAALATAENRPWEIYEQELAIEVKNSLKY